MEESLAKPSSSRDLINSERIILPRKEKPQIEIHIVKNRPTLESRIVKKRRGESSNVKQNIDKKEETAMAPSTSSQAYKKYLEEMELKIRYMKNDIEFKQEQVRKRKINDATPSGQNEHLFQQKAPVQKNRTIVVPPIRKDTGPFGMHPQNFHPNSVPYITNSQALSHRAIQKSVMERLKPPLQSTEIKIVHRKPAYTDSSLTLPEEQRVKAQSTQSLDNKLHVTSTSFPSQYNRTIVTPHHHYGSQGVLEISQSSVPQHHYSQSQSLRTVLIPSRKAKAAQVIQEESIVNPESSNRCVLTNIKPISLHAIQTSSPDMLFTSSMIPTTLQTSPSKYKYVAPKLMGKDNIVSSFSAPTVCSLMPSTSQTMSLSNQASVPSVVKSRIVLKRQTSGEVRASKKITPLKLKTAAKLVSKYKFKRLSPTSASKIAPKFCPPSPFFPGCHWRAEISSALSSSKAVKVNLFKLDKRKRKAEASENHKLPSGKSLPPNQRDQNHTKRKSKSRFSVKYVNMPAANTSGQYFSSRASGLPISGLHRAGKHRWASIDVRSEHLKSKLAAKRYAALAPFRWKSSKPNASAASASQFKWLQGQKPMLRHKFHQGHHIQKFVPRHSQRSTRLVMIGGVVYRSSLTCLKRAAQCKGREGRLLSRQELERKETKRPAVLKNSRHQNLKLIRLRGIHYHIDARGKKLCRVSGSELEKGTLQKMIRPDLEKVMDIHKKVAASRAVQRSLAWVAAKHKKDNRLKKGRPRNCLFFSRFGKCHRGDACPYIHDITKVVVCTRFLRGKCDGVGCLFSHEATVHKMPVCLFYLQGLCAREDCLYLHVNVSQDAAPCKDFLQGYCALGEKCKKLHSFLCPSFAVFGKCTRGDNCSLLHRQSKKSQIESHSSLSRPVPNLPMPRESKGVQNNVAAHESLSSAALAQDFVLSNASSPLAQEGDGSSPPPLKSSPLKSQPAFISLLSIAALDAQPAGCKGNPHVAPSMGEKKTKIKPEFKLETATEASADQAREDSRVTEGQNRQSAMASPTSSTLIPVEAEEGKKASGVDYSGFINFSEGESVESGGPQGGVKPRRDAPPPPEEGMRSKATLAKAGLLNKGIIPNFLPSTLPMRSSPE